jgi:hypothetical protein
MGIRGSGRKGAWRELGEVEGMRRRGREGGMESKEGMEDEGRGVE